MHSFDLFLISWFCVVSSFLYVAPDEWIDICHMDRNVNPDALGQHTFFTASFMINGAIFTAILSLLLLIWHGKEHRYEVLVDAVSTLLWYQSSYSVVWSLKHVLEDSLCSRYVNGVSGHYNMYVFASVSLMFLTVKSRRNARILSNYFNKRVFRAVLRLSKQQSGRRIRLTGYAVLVSVFTFAFFAVTNGWRTWAYGYHTLRHIGYGSLSAIANLYLWSHSIGFAYGKHHRHRGRVLLRVSLFAVVTTVVKLVVAPLWLWDHLFLVAALFSSMWICHFVFPEKHLGHPEHTGYDQLLNGSTKNPP